MIKYKKGDLLTSVKDPNVFIAHGCNCRGVMGSGFALQVKIMYPKVYEEYKKTFDKGNLQLGTIQFVHQHKDLPCIVNMQTQDGYGRKGVFVDYCAVRSCFKEFSILNINKQDLHIPKIGAGLAGGDYDEAYTIPTPKAQRLSLRTMQLLIEEIGLTDTVDPLGGSYFETLTNQMEEKMVEAIRGVDAQGGIVKAVSEGVIQAKVSEYAYQRQRALENGELRKVGVNCYEDTDEEKRRVELHPYDEAGARAQIESVRVIRSERDGDAVERALKTLRADAAAGRNVMPALVEAVKAYATVGEMSGALVDVFGRFEEPTRLWRRAG